MSFIFKGARAKAQARTYEKPLFENTLVLLGLVICGSFRLPIKAQSLYAVKNMGVRRDNRASGALDVRIPNEYIGGTLGIGQVKHHILEHPLTDSPQTASPRSVLDRLMGDGP